MASGNSYNSCVGILGPSLAREEEGILIHVLRRGSTGTKIWIADEASLSNLDVPVDFREDLRRFWHSHRSFFISRQTNHRGLAQDDGLVVIAERLIGRRSLLIFGAGHVGYSVALMGAI